MIILPDFLKRRITMSAKRSKAENRALLMALAYIVMGILFCVKQGAVLNWIMYVAGILFIVQGVLDIIYRKPVAGIIEVVLGVAILYFGIALLNIAVLALGIVLVVYSIANLFQYHQNFFTILVNLLTALVGVMLILNQWVVYDWFFIVLGIALIVNGVLTLFNKK